MSQQDDWNQGFATGFVSGLSTSGPVIENSFHFFRKLGTRLYTPRLFTEGTNVVTDSFTRANSSTSLGVADTGQAWTNLRGTFGILNNTAYITAVSSGVQTVVNAGISDCVLKSTIVAKGTAPGFIYRAVDNLNHLLGRINNTTAEIYRCLNGVYTLLASQAGVTLNAGDIFMLKCVGEYVALYVNGAIVLSASVPSYLTATKHGLRSDSTLSVFDDFTVSNIVVASEATIVPRV